MQTPDTSWSPVLMPAGAQRPYLVIVRTGKDSLHTSWPRAAQRNWDLLVSHYDEGSEPPLQDAEIAVRQGAFKFGAIHRLFQDIPFLSSYRAVWLCDDDIMTSWQDINSLFEIFGAHGLALAQPALTRDSYASMGVCLQREECLLRYTNFVEIMAPLFSAQALQTCLPSFEGAITGWGLDFVWPHLLQSERPALAVIDAIAVKHTRPVAGGAIYAQAKAYGLTPDQECAQNLSKHGLASRPSQHELGLLWREPQAPTSQKQEIEARLRQLVLSSLSAPPPSWAALSQGWQAKDPWASGPSATYELPPLSAQDWALTLSVTLELEASSQNGACLLSLGQEPQRRLALFCARSSETAYRLALTLQNESGQFFSLMSGELPFGKQARFAIELVPVIGWVRLRLQGALADEGLIAPYRWGEAKGLVLGDPALQGRILALHLQPWLPPSS